MMFRQPYLLCLLFSSFLVKTSVQAVAVPSRPVRDESLVVAVHVYVHTSKHAHTNAPKIPSKPPVPGEERGVMASNLKAYEIQAALAIGKVQMMSSQDQIKKCLTQPLDGEDKWWQRVTQMYSESQRHYHTFNHITCMWSFLNKYKDHLHKPELVGYAIIFHDLVYNPKAPDNEERSADMFMEFIKDVKEKNVSQYDYMQESDNYSAVKDMILLTKSHKTDAHTTPGAYGSDDSHFLLDFDMQVLGWSPDAYRKYAAQIRQEYIHVPELTFKQKRAQVLRNFLSVPNIFATKIFRDMYEGQARLNIASEIQRLES